MIQITKVVTKSFIHDFVAKIQNFLGLNIKSYEKMVEKGHNQIKKEIEEKGIEFDWYRMQVTQLTNGALVVMVYGDSK